MLSFSVLIPVYNGEKYLARALDSVLAQSYPHFELIVCDDASTDSTPEILRNYAEKDSRIRIITHEKNQSAFTTRNNLIRAAKNPFCTFIDADDTVSADFLKRSSRILNEKEYDILEFSYDAIGGNFLKRLIYRGGKECETNGKEIFEYFLFHKQNPWSIYAKIFRTELLKQVLMPDDQIFFANDYLLTIPAFHSAESYRFVKQTMYFYHLTTGSWGQKRYTIQRFETMNRSIYESQKKILDFFRKNNLGKRYEQQFFQAFNCAHVLDLINSDKIECGKDEAYRIFLKYKSQEELCGMFLNGKILLNDSTIKSGIHVFLWFLQIICRRWIKRVGSCFR